MREQEMRMRVFRFLKAQMRNMIMPATVGIGLAVGGCGDSVSEYSAPVYPDDASVTRKDSVGVDSPVLGPDASLGPDAQVVADASQNPDTPSKEVAQSEAGPTGVDSGTDLGTIITKYIAPVPDAGADALVLKYSAPVPDAGALDAAMDLGLITKYIAPVYIAQMPDAADDSGPAVEKYSAPVKTDASLAVRYMAQMPDAV
jgi:hypothetical protein